MRVRSLIVLAACFIIAACGTSNSPEDVVTDIYELTTSGDLEAALELLVVEKRSTSDSSLRSLAKIRDSLNASGFSGLAISGSQEEGVSMRVYFKEQYESGKEKDGGAQLLQEDGQWKLKSLYVPGGVGGRGGHRL